MQPNQNKRVAKASARTHRLSYGGESLKPCLIPSLLVPKKDNTMSMCVDIRVNTTTPSKI